MALREVLGVLLTDGAGMLGNPGWPLLNPNGQLALSAINVLQVLLKECPQLRLISGRSARHQGAIQGRCSPGFRLGLGRVQCNLA